MNNKGLFLGCPFSTGHSLHYTTGIDSSYMQTKIIKVKETYVHIQIIYNIASPQIQPIDKNTKSYNSWQPERIDHSSCPSKVETNLLPKIITYLP